MCRVNKGLIKKNQTIITMLIHIKCAIPSTKKTQILDLLLLLTITPHK